MVVSNDLKTHLVNELRYVATQIVKTPDVAYSNYVFSGAHAMTNRILNLAFDKELVLINDVLQSAHQAIHNRINFIAAGREGVIDIPAELFLRLSTDLMALAASIESDEPIIEPLARIAVAGYVTTGNGYYLYQKGLLKL